jgi:serine/threonine protein kinase
LERFAREAQVLSTLSHPGIVRYIDSGITAGGEPYLVMEWLSGETLSSRLQRTQLTLAEVLALGRRVASALSAIHREGIVHRDIKPSNLFLRDSAIDKVTLIDFGMARRPLADTRLTVTGTMLGTPGYIAPEQVYNVPNLDGRADIFSLGCVLYRCIAGRAPFRGPDALRTMVSGLRGNRRGSASSARRSRASSTIWWRACCRSRPRTGRRAAMWSPPSCWRSRRAIPGRCRRLARGRAV